MVPMTPNRPSTDQDGSSGYSMIELVVVVSLIVIMAAISIPNIAGYLRNYRIRGATQQLAGEIQTARNKAIARNTNNGMVFRIYDSDSYRINLLDDQPPNAPVAAGLGPLRTLPAGVAFVVAAGTPTPGVGFDRLGRPCQLGTNGCPTVASTNPGAPANGCTEAACTDRAAANTYVDFTGGNFIVTVREEATQQLRTVTIGPGGRVLTAR
jgi:prepilin-type N-terminal cleavage/methylation domain-containing protein